MDPAFWLALAAAVLSAFSIVLHVIAPRTKTTVDDRLRDDVDELLAFVRGKPAATTVAVVVPTSLPGRGQAGRVSFDVQLGIAAAAIGIAAAIFCSLPGCAPAEAVVAAAPAAAKDAVVDCVKADQAPIVRLLVQLGADALTYVLHGGVVDWDALEVAAWAEGKTTGGCALAEFVAGVTSKQPAARTLMGAPDPALVALERLRQQAGGVQWRTPGGML